MLRLAGSAFAVCLSYVLICFGFGLAEFVGSSILESSMYTVPEVDALHGYGVAVPIGYPGVGGPEAQFDANRHKLEESLLTLERLCDVGFEAACLLIPTPLSVTKEDKERALQALRDAAFQHFAGPVRESIEDLDRWAAHFKAQPFAFSQDPSAHYSDRLESLSRQRDGFEKQLAAYETLADGPLREAAMSMMSPMVQQQLDNVVAEMDSLLKSMQRTKDGGLNTESLLTTAERPVEGR
jgi:hypothetical protein